MKRHKIIFLMKSLIICYFVITTTCGCLPIAADGIIRFEGVIVNSEGKAINNCRLEMYTKRYDSKPFFAEYVKSAFIVGSTCDPNCQEYFVVIECHGKSGRYISNLYNNCEYLEPTINLGRIIIKGD